MSDLDEPIDPLDPRFVDAVLARARQRAIPTEPAAAAPETIVAETVVPETIAPRVAAVEANPVVPEPAPDATVADDAPIAEPVAAPMAGDSAHAAAAYNASPFPNGPFSTEPPTSLDDDDDDYDDASRRTRNAVEWIAVAVGAVVVAFLIRAFLLQAFYIPSESMEPTLRKDDRILVNKLSYKFHDINRGDLVVFEKPPNEPASDINDLIKRVIALPNETIELHTDGTITIDDRLLSEPYLRDGQPPGQMTMARDAFVERACTNPVSETTKCTVGEGFVWVMGDNRDHSHDSRAFGPIDQDLVVGRAFIKVWPLSKIGFL